MYLSYGSTGISVISTYTLLWLCSELQSSFALNFVVNVDG